MICLHECKFIMELDSLKLELQMVWATMWILKIKSRSSTIECSFLLRCPHPYTHYTHTLLFYFFILFLFLCIGVLPTCMCEGLSSLGQKLQTVVSIWMLGIELRSSEKVVGVLNHLHTNVHTHVHTQTHTHFFFETDFFPDIQIFPDIFKLVCNQR